MEKIYLFTDCSVAPQNRVGVGGYFCLDEIKIEASYLSDRAKLRIFNDVSSTQLELKTLLWALSEIGERAKKVVAYTDSQNIVSLLGRREKLLEKDFKNRSNTPLKHKDLYREFFQRLDALNLQIFKVRGHCQNSEKSEIEKIFSVLDKLTRKELRKQSAILG